MQPALCPADRVEFETYLKLRECKLKGNEIRVESAWFQRLQLKHKHVATAFQVILAFNFNRSSTEFDDDRQSSTDWIDQ